jgi:hypothetical protein
MLPLVREAIVMFRVYKIFPFKKRPPHQRGPGSGGMDSQDFPYRVFPEGEDVIV